MQERIDFYSNPRHTVAMKENNSKNEIFTVALQLFSQKGYDAVSPNEIVEKVGVKKPTLYYFFGSKEGLLENILHVCYEKLDTSLIENCIYTPNQKQYYEDIYPTLIRVVMTYFNFAKENQDFYSMVMSLAFMPRSSTSARLSEQYQIHQYLILENMFKDIAKVHPNLEGKERIYTWRFLALINAQIGFWQRGYDTLNETIAASIVKGFMHGIFS